MKLPFCVQLDRALSREMARLGAGSVGSLCLSGRLLAWGIWIDASASFWHEQVCELVGIRRQDLKIV